MEQVTLDMWIAGLGNFGFPIALAVYLLIRFEKKIEALTAAIETLKNTFVKKQ